MIYTQESVSAHYDDVTNKLLTIDRTRMSEAQRLKAIDKAYKDHEDWLVDLWSYDKAGPKEVSLTLIQRLKSQVRHLNLIRGLA